MSFRFVLFRAPVFKILFAFTALLFHTANAGAQTKTEEEKAGKDELSVVLHTDPRLAVLTAYEETIKTPAGSASGGKATGVIRSGKGFRVMIYSGTDRAKANSTKADFMRRHPGVRIYMTYALPQYRIKVGDFSSRQEAYELYRQLSGIYSPCMIVPDIVEINTFRKNDGFNTPEGK